MPFYITKQPSEVLPNVTVDFINRLLAGETLIGQTVTAYVKGVEEPGIVDSSTILGTKVLATLKGGADGQRVRVSFIATGDKGSVIEGDVEMIVREE